MVVARLAWAERLRGRRVLYFIDNDSARQALIKSYSPVLASLRIVLDCLKWDMDNQSNAWYARVPTASNIADGPSRMSSWEVVRALSAQPTKPIFSKEHWAYLYFGVGVMRRQPVLPLTFCVASISAREKKQNYMFIFCISALYRCIHVGFVWESRLVGKCRGD